MTVGVEERVVALCADRLGLDRGSARTLIDQARRRVGRRGWWLRALAFAVAVHPRLRGRLPTNVRRRAVVAFVGPLLHSAAALNAYGADRTTLLGDPTAGLLRRP